MKIKEINELLKKAFHQECYLEDDLKPFYTLKFPGVSRIGEFEEIKGNCEKFLSQYDIKIGASIIRYPIEANKVFVLQIDKLPLEKFLEKLNGLMNNIQLQEAANKGDVERVNRLLNDGACVNSKNIVGETPLHVAARMGHDEVIDVLLEQEAEVNSINNAGETPLHIVAQTNHVSTLEKILARPETDMQNKDEHGNTCLHLAARVGNKEIMGKFFNYPEKLKEIINLQNEFGETALRVADDSENVEVAKILIHEQLKEDPNTKKPSFDILDELSDYWDEQMEKRADKPAIEEGATGGTAHVLGVQKMENLIRFFSMPGPEAANSTDADVAQKEKKPALGNLAK